MNKLTFSQGGRRLLIKVVYVRAVIPYAHAVKDPLLNQQISKRNQRLFYYCLCIYLFVHLSLHICQMFSAKFYLHADTVQTHHCLVGLVHQIQCYGNIYIFFLTQRIVKWIFIQFFRFYCHSSPQDEQGWIHGYLSHVRVGRGHIRGRFIIWAGAVTDRPTNDRLIDRPTREQR